MIPMLARDAGAALLALRHRPATLAALILLLFPVGVAVARSIADEADRDDAAARAAQLAIKIQQEQNRQLGEEITGRPSSPGSAAPLPAGPPALPAVVLVTDAGCQPPTSTVSEGGTVSWRNATFGSVELAADPDDGSGFGTRTLGPGEEFSHTFRKRGTHAYSCGGDGSFDSEVEVRRR